MLIGCCSHDVLESQKDATNITKPDPIPLVTLVLRSRITKDAQEEKTGNMCVTRGVQETQIANGRVPHYVHDLDVPLVHVINGDHDRKNKDVMHDVTPRQV